MKIGSVVSDSIQVIKYIMKNPQKHGKHTLTKLKDEAQYGDIIPIVKGYKGLSLVTLDEFLDQFNIDISRDNITIPYPSLEPGSIRPLETLTLCVLAKATNAQRIFEIGTFRGKTSTNLSYNISGSSSVMSLCLPQDQCAFEVGEYVKKDTTASLKTRLLSGDSLMFDFAPYHDSVDLMFIDGCHTYKHTLADSENAMKCIRDNGFIVWHDFNTGHLGSAKAVLEITEKYGLDLYKIDGTSIAIAPVNKKQTSQ